VTEPEPERSILDEVVAEEDATLPFTRRQPEPPAPTPVAELALSPAPPPAISAPAPAPTSAAPRAPAPLPQRRPKKLFSALEALTKTPENFTFDAGVRILLAASPDIEDEDRLRFTATPSLAQPTAEITSAQAPIESDRARLSTPLIGLTGASGVMPRWYTELVAQAVRAKSRAIADFFDLLAQRLITAFAQAGAKYRLHRSAETARYAELDEPVGASLLALTGYGTAGMSDRLAAGGPDLLRHYSGFFAARPRSTDRLQSMVSDYLGRKVEIIEFAGAWLTVPPDGQSRMPKGRVAGSFNALGVNCAIGTRAWDQQARFIVRVGPLKRDEFEALLPDRQGLKELVSLIRAYVGWECDFAINLLLSTSEIPSLQMAGGNAQNAPRLGWTCWMPSTTARLTGSKYVDEAMFGATLVESMN
jgi:type VI secretion system protein ImpH